MALPSNWYAMTGHLATTGCAEPPVFSPNPRDQPVGWQRVGDGFGRELSWSTLDQAQNFLIDRGFTQSTDPSQSDIWLATPPQAVEGTRFDIIRIVTLRVYS